QQVPDEPVAKVALEARYAAEAGDEAETEFGESEAGHLVGDDDVADESEFESATEADAMDGGYRNERRFIEPVENRVNVFDEVADTLRAKLWLEFNRAMIKLAQVGSGAEATFLCTRNDARGGFGREVLGGFDEFFELTEHHGADF